MDIPLKYSIFHTSIHDRATLLKAFSKGVIKREAKAKIIKERLKEYAKNTFSSAVVLLSKDYLEMASHYSKKDYLNVCESVAPHFIDAMSRLTDYNLIADNTTVDVQFDKDFRLGGQKLKSEDKTEQTEKENAVIFVKTFLVQGMKFHILSMSRNKRTIKLSEDHLPVLASHLENLITEMNA